MGSIFDSEFEEMAAPDLLERQGVTVSYTPSGSSARSRAALWELDSTMVEQREYHEIQMRSGVLHIRDDADSGIATVTPHADKCTIDGVLYLVQGIDAHQGGMWMLRLEQTKAKTARRPGRELDY